MARRPGLTTGKVVATAAALVDRDGLEALSLAAVARELGVRTPSLYNHVDGLEGLRHELTLLALDELGSRLQRAAVGRAGAEAVRAVGHAFRRFATEHPGLYALTVPSSTDDQLAAAADGIVETVLAALGSPGLDDPGNVHAARTLRSAVHGFVTLELAGGFGLPVGVDESFERLLEVVLVGLGLVPAPTATPDPASAPTATPDPAPAPTTTPDPAPARR